MAYQALVQRHAGVAIDVAVLTATVNGAGDALLGEVVLDGRHVGHLLRRGVVDVHFRLPDKCQVCRLIAVAGLAA